MWLTSLLATLAKPIELVVTGLNNWSERRDKINEAKLAAELATIHAKAEMAAYKAKADVEWDLAWAGQAQSSWKDEYILILWTIPMLAFLPALFFPSMQDNLLTTLKFFQELFGPDLLYWYMGGWGVIFSATYGMKGALQFMVPGNAAKLVGVLNDTPDDIPDTVVQATTEKIKQMMAGVGKK